MGLMGWIAVCPRKGTCVLRKQSMCMRAHRGRKYCNLIGLLWSELLGILGRVSECIFSVVRSSLSANPVMRPSDWQGKGAENYGTCVCLCGRVELYKQRTGWGEGWGWGRADGPAADCIKSTCTSTNKKRRSQKERRLKIMTLLNEVNEYFENYSLE